MNNRKEVRLILRLSVLLGLILVACTAPADETAPPGETIAEPVIPEEAAELVAQVQTDLAARLSVDKDQISVVEVKAVEWSDTSLGCPEPGNLYDQVITPGYEIELEAGDTIHTYHTGPDNYVLCGDDGTASPETPMTGDRPSGQEEDSVLARLVEQAVQDLSARLGIPEHTIEVVSIEAVQWSDSSLGCPEPGMAYLTMITPGYLIRLAVDELIYEYHTDLERVLYCETPSSESPGSSSMEAMVRADLADRLGITENEIVVVAVKPMEWPDSGLGCPQPGGLYEQVISPGYRIVLEAVGREYVYHTGPDSFVLCEETSSTGPAIVERPTEVIGLDPELAELVDQAKEDLSKRLDVPLDRINLKSAEAVQWRDSSLGCPEPGMAYLTVITPGYLIVLEVDGEIYEYHADTSRVVYCEDPQPPIEDL